MNIDSLATGVLWQAMDHNHAMVRWSPLPTHMSHQSSACFRSATSEKAFSLPGGGHSGFGAAAAFQLLLWRPSRLRRRVRGVLSGPGFTVLSCLSRPALQSPCMSLAVHALLLVLGQSPACLQQVSV